jgi:imidazolonepropionase-like amidohydrolase
MDEMYEQLREMHDHGVAVMAGTDTGAALVFPGSALHEELELLVSKCHFTPMEALLGATIIPAKIFGLEDDLGTVATGKLADMVLLKANPLDDIHNTKSIGGVMFHGKWLDEKGLTALRAKVEHDVRASYPVNKSD